MHDIEPYYNWRHIYIAEEDERSPFYEKVYNEFEFTHSIYGYCIHPQWDDIGSPTLFIKILLADYDTGFAVIELLGEWNDCINNDIMFFKRDVIDKLIEEGISKFILVGENLLNFHHSDESYYEEWLEDISPADGWIALVGFRDHILSEFEKTGIAAYFRYGDASKNLAWRTYNPVQLLQEVKRLVPVALNA